VFDRWTADIDSLGGAKSGAHGVRLREPRPQRWRQLGGLSDPIIVRRGAAFMKVRAPCPRVRRSVECEALAPVAFRIYVPVMPASITGSHPYRPRARRLFPVARAPMICASIPMVVTRHPHMLAAGPRCPMLPDADRGPNLHHHFRMNRYDPNGKTKQRGKQKFSHPRLLGRLWARGGPFSFSMLPQGVARPKAQNLRRIYTYATTFRISRRVCRDPDDIAVWLNMRL
jgi:hypothetical protein